jgi:hypothetical protein
VVKGAGDRLQKVRVATSLKILKSYISCNINNCFKKVIASPLLQTVHINF